jgi:hypothetical protein
MILLFFILSLSMPERLELLLQRLDIDIKLENQQEMYRDSQEIYDLIMAIEND